MNEGVFFLQPSGQHHSRHRPGRSCSVGCGTLSIGAPAALSELPTDEVSLELDPSALRGFLHADVGGHALGELGEVGHDAEEPVVRLQGLKSLDHLVERHWPRLRRGLKALFRGTTERDGEERLHQFVRALEALLRPEIGNTRSQFAHRTDQTFTVANAETREALLQIFDMRSQVEHLHPVLDALDGDEAMRIATANRRTRQVDILARFALRRVLTHDALLETFKTEVGIEGFWSLPDAARVGAWGGRLDLRTIV